ncbi:MAG: hypothetical protein QOE03_343 [Micromonosporaceae bacterium]|nr:hypothetical protein [Micromonosporaceae bacterium]
MTIAHPIARAWLATGTGPSTTAQNYDEFADDAEITAIIAANPYSALAVEMPHLAPESLPRPFADCLPDAVARLAAAKAVGRYAEADDVAVLYRVTAPGSSPGYGLWTMIDTGQISTSADEPGLVIRNEDVFEEKVRERVALAEALGHLLSPVLLLQTVHADDLHTALAAACEAAAHSAPAAADTDPAGRVHEIWPLGPGEVRTRLLALAGGGELVVADGNHRSLAAQNAGLPRFLAVVTTPASVTIQPYNRLVSELMPAPVELVARLAAAGAEVTTLSGTPGVPARGGTVHLYTAAGAWAVALPTSGSVGGVHDLDHTLVERHVFGDALGLDPGDKRITYVGGDYPPEWLRAEVDSGRAALAVLIAPVTVDDYIAVNLARQQMPRKSTWFTPKARAGLVVADLSTDT